MVKKTNFADESLIANFRFNEVPGGLVPGCRVHQK